MVTGVGLDVEDHWPWLGCPPAHPWCE